jgi:IS1 family transposase
LSAQKNKIWLWTAVDPFKQGILGWVVGDLSAKTFAPLWAIVSTWQCYFYVTDGWSVYPCFIPEGDQIISKTYYDASGRRKHPVTQLFSAIASQDSLLF